MSTIRTEEGPTMTQPTPHAHPPAPEIEIKRPTAGLPALGARVEKSPTKTALNIDAFSAWYGSFQALHRIVLNVPHCRVTAFIGPSGCGKSTLLRWINRMNDLIPTAKAEGTLDLHGMDLLARVTDVVDLRRRVGMVFQKPNPFPKSIYDNVAFGPRLHYRISRNDLADLVERSLTAAGLWNEVKDRLDSSALGLSGGQQQRLCIARAIAVGPEMLLMDEPCSALDPKSTARVEDLIRELREKYTIIIVTHNMQQAARVSDVTAFFFEGRLVEAGNTADIFTNPRNPQTEDYVTGRFGGFGTPRIARASGKFPPMGIDLVTELVEVRRMILTMAAAVEQQVDRALRALQTKDIALAREVRDSDSEINQVELDIENECLRIFALTHPVAGDLRFVMAVLRMNGNLERIGDKAKSIAKRVIDLTDCAPLPFPTALVDMARDARTMLGNALTALSNEDADLARNVRRSDDRVDDLQRQVFTWAHLEIPRHVETTQAVIDVLSIARALERIADLSTNIAEDVIFLVEGSVVRHTKE